jgi:hypothetical protein
MIASGTDLLAGTQSGQKGGYGYADEMKRKITTRSEQNARN